MGSYLNDIIFLLVNKNINFVWFFYFLRFLFFFSSRQWFMLWLCLEINTLIFLPIFIQKKTLYKLESILVYYLLQRISSILLLLRLLIEENQTTRFVTIKSVFLVAIFLKVGRAPLHTWFPLVAHAATIKILWFLLTLQKLIPILILIIIKTNLLILLGFIIFSAFLGPILNFSQNNIKFILVFSSLSHIAWLIRGIYLSFQGWAIYFLVYLIICNFVLLSLTKFLNQNSLNPKNNFKQILLFLNFGGLPPLLGFYPKFFVIVFLLEKRNTLLLMLLLIRSVLDFFIYTRIFYSFMFTKSNKLIWKILKKKSILEILYLTRVFFLGFFILI